MTLQNNEPHLEAAPGAASETEESPENLPISGWASLIGFAIFVIAFGACSVTFMFN